MLEQAQLTSVCQKWLTNWDVCQAFVDVLAGQLMEERQRHKMHKWQKNTARRGHPAASGWTYKDVTQELPQRGDWLSQSEQAQEKTGLGKGKKSKKANKDDLKVEDIVGSEPDQQEPEKLSDGQQEGSKVPSYYDVNEGSEYDEEEEHESEEDEKSDQQKPPKVGLESAYLSFI